MDEATHELLRRINQLNTRIETHLREEPPNLDAATNAQRELAQLERQRNRLWLKRTAFAGQVQLPDLPLRDQVANVLNELKVAASPSFISRYHEIRFGEPLSVRRLSSLKRDERKSFSAAPRQRPFYVVSALEVSRLQPVRGLLALSTFEPEKRFIGPLSPRVDYLQTVMRICTLAAQAESPIARASLEHLLWQLARNLPVSPTLDGHSRVEQLKSLANSELKRFEVEDFAERRRAAERAETLPELHRLFGSPPLAAVGIGASYGR